MGNFVSKSPLPSSSSSSTYIPNKVPKSVNKPANFDENFGRQIMKNIKLKESPFVSVQKEVSASSNLRKRMELDKQTEGTISWDDFPLIFQENGTDRIKLDKSKIEEIKKYFKLPSKPIKQ